MAAPITLAEIEKNLARNPEIKQLREGVPDVKAEMEKSKWSSEVSGSSEDLGRWSPILMSLFCALIHLPALALESCWPSLLGQIFRLDVAPQVLTTSHWIALGATIVCLAINMAFLWFGASKRRGFAPWLVGLAGTWLVVLNPLYFLLADYEYLVHSNFSLTRSGTDAVVLLLTICGVAMLIVAACWNASLDRKFLDWWRIPGARGRDGSVLVASCDEGLELDEDIEAMQL